MSPSKFKFESPSDASSAIREDGIQSGFIGKLQGLKYQYRPDSTHLNDFAEILLVKCTLGQTISRIRQDCGNGNRHFISVKAMNITLN